MQGANVSYSITPAPTTLQRQPEVQQHPKTALLHIWLHPRAALAGLAAGSGWSWLAPIGIGLLVFYTRIFTLAYVGERFMYEALMAGAAGIVVGWPVCAALLYALTALTGSRPGFVPLLLLCAWATLPLTLRSALQVIYMLSAGQPLGQPGLAGLLAGMDASHWTVRTGQLVLGQLDLFTGWHLGLLALAVSVAVGVSISRALIVVGMYVALNLLFAMSWL